MPAYSFTMTTTGEILAFDEATAEATLRDLWKNVEPWLNAPTIAVKEAGADVRV